MTDMSDILADVLCELDEARLKHPLWPDDGIHALAIIQEEIGEAFQSALDAAYRGGEHAHIRAEISSAAAMCLRFLDNWDRMRVPRSTQHVDDDLTAIGKRRTNEKE